MVYGWRRAGGGKVFAPGGVSAFQRCGRRQRDTKMTGLPASPSASLGVCWDSADRRGLVSRPYRTDELILAVHPDHPLADRGSLTFAQSLDFEHVGLPPATAVYTMLNRAAATAGRKLTYRAIVSNFDAAIRVVRANLGVSVIPREVSSQQITTGQVVALALEDDWARRRFVLCCKAPDSMTPAAGRLAEFLVARAVS